MLMISFRCKKCGTTINAALQHAGKKAPCPACRCPLVVPQPDAEAATPAKKAGPNPPLAPQKSAIDTRLFDNLPPEPQSEPPTTTDNQPTSSAAAAQGAVRAPDIMENSPGLSEMWSYFLNIVVCVAVFIMPAILYHIYLKQTDLVFWLLVAYAVALFPMGLLAVLLFDSYSALNPLLLIPSIFSTFFQYFGLIVLTGLLLFGFTTAANFFPEASFVRYMLQTFFIYWLIVIAHLLSRFFWKYKNKLNWDV